MNVSRLMKQRGFQIKYNYEASKSISVIPIIEEVNVCPLTNLSWPQVKLLKASEYPNRSPTKSYNDWTPNSDQKASTLRRAKSPEDAADLKEQAKAITKKLVPLRKQKQVAQRIEEDIPKIWDWMEQERAMEMGEGRNNKSKRRELWIIIHCF